MLSSNEPAVEGDSMDNERYSSATRKEVLKCTGILDEEEQICSERATKNNQNSNKDSIPQTEALAVWRGEPPTDDGKYGAKRREEILKCKGMLEEKELILAEKSKSKPSASDDSIYQTNASDTVQNGIGFDDLDVHGAYPSPELRSNNRLETSPGALHSMGQIHNESTAIENAGGISYEENNEDIMSSTIYGARLVTPPTQPEQVEMISASVMDSNEKPAVRKRTKAIIVIIAVLLVTIVGIIVFVMFREGSNDHDSFEETMDPTGSPTTEAFRDSALRSFLAGRANGGVEFAEDTPYALAANWVIDEDPTQLKEPSDKLLQRFVLATIYFETTQVEGRTWRRCGPPSFEDDDGLCFRAERDVMRWLTGSDECTWFGIECFQENDIIGSIKLYQQGLTGSIPSLLYLLSNLVRLGLSGNGQLIGSIPESIYRLTKLSALELGFVPSMTGTISTRIGLLTDLFFFGVGGNDIHGTIPSEIGMLTNLVELELAKTRLSGTIPEELYGLVQLKYFLFYQTLVSGSLSTRIGHLTDLNLFTGYDTLLSGTLPSEFGLCKQLVVFQNHGVSTSGTIPTQIGMLEQLANLSLGGKDLVGTIPEELYDLTKLTTVFVRGVNISGTISTKIGSLRDATRFVIMESRMISGLPTEIGNMEKLEGLHIESTFPTSESNASFKSDIPSEIGRLKKLEILHLQGGLVSGRIPSELGNLSNLVYLTAGYNALNGTLPTELGGLRKIKVVDLVDNQITGTLPTELGNCQKLEHFELGQNNFSGSLPPELGNLQLLTHLAIHDNKGVTGMIPSQIFGLELLQTLLMNSTSVSGSLDSEIGNMRWLKEADFSLTLLEGSVPDEICQLSSLKSLSADCSPVDNPPMPCKCCTQCCDRDSAMCEDV